MFLTRSASLLYDSVLALLYPQACVICGNQVEARADGIACADCWSNVKIFQPPDALCWKCGALSLGTISTAQKEQVRCRRCDHQSFENARACGVYEGALRASVLTLKREPKICSRVIELLEALVSQEPLNSATAIVPVPLHPEREKVRGFNQATVIAQHVARSAKLPCHETCLIRTQHSEQHRAGMDAKGRRDTVANAFAVNQPRLVSRERILLVDDVFTTGATVSACADALLACGAELVLVITLARTLR